MKRKVLGVCLETANDYLHKHVEPYCHFSFIVQNNKIIEWGTNRCASPLTFLGYPVHSKMHSEVDAYFKAKGILGKGPFEVVNIRLTKTAMIRNSRPCRCCFEFLRGLECKRIWFTTNLGNFARMDFVKNIA
jgi:hypothetical protein